jgi:hypothetical protein
MEENSRIFEEHAMADEPTKKDSTAEPAQPGPALREAMSDPETQRRDAEDRRVTNEAHRWGQEGNSRKERGYPREGDPDSKAGKE